MVDNKFKTRLEIAKNKISKKDTENKDNKPSLIGHAFKMSTELVYQFCAHFECVSN